MVNQSMNIVQNGSITTIEFFGKLVSRQDYIVDFVKFLTAEYLCGERSKELNAFVHIMLEASKNVYDHGNGKAVVTLTEIDSIITFEFIDENPEIINFSEISDPKNWQKKTEHNAGGGLRLIRTHYGKLVTDFKTDDTKGGVNYSGKFLRPQIAI